MRTAIPFLLLTSLSIAQETVAPTPDKAGIPRGETWNGYNIVDSIETGYRFAVSRGDRDMYRSSVNYGNGIRLLGSHFSMNSKTGQSPLFDSLVITTEGLGNDPYENASLRVRKNRTYSYDMDWRRNDYFNPGLVTGGASGAHLLDTQYDMQDHNLTLFPDSRFQFFLGFTGTSQTGAGLTTVQPLDRGDVIPLFSNVRRFRREYRVGNEFRVFGLRVNWMRGWDDFKEETPPANADSSAQHLEPYHGTSPYWRVGLFLDRRSVSLNGRFTYTSGRRSFIADETVLGPAALAQSRQVVSAGNAQRPVVTGNLNVVITPVSKLTFVNSASFYSVRTSGDAQFTQLDNSVESFAALNYQFLGIRTISNETDLNYQFSPAIGAFAGYEYSERVIRSQQQTTVLGTVFPLPGRQTNHQNDGRIGLRVRPLKPLSILVSAEIGRGTHPFTPIAERDYHALNGRIQYRSKSLLLSAGAESDYRFNSVTLSSYSSRSRKYFADGSWNLPPGLAVNASFSRAHLDSMGGIAYFQNLQFIEGEQSIYISNLNTVTAGIQYNAGRRATLYAAYIRSQDLGDGRSRLPDSLFAAAQTFPMTFESPLARISFRLAEKLRWNAGYQYYGYRARFYPSRNFRANTGYTSLTWSF